MLSSSAWLASLSMRPRLRAALLPILLALSLLSVPPASAFAATPGGLSAVAVSANQIDQSD